MEKIGEEKHIHQKSTPPDDGNDSIDDTSPLISLSSDRSESMGWDAIEECAGVTFSVSAMGGTERQRRLKISEASTTEEWIQQTVSAMPPCDICDVCEKSYPHHESIEFWRSIDECSDLRTRCHKKFYKRLIQRFREVFPEEAALRNSRTMNLLKNLLHIEGTDDTVEVYFDKFVRVLKFFGPVKLSGQRCILLEQLQLLIDKSLRYNKQRKEKISWFAGDMTRQQAESKLNSEPGGTYLIRMSQNNSEHGDFVLSVKQGDAIHHIEIKGQPLKAFDQQPFSSCLIFKEKEYSSLIDLVEDLKYDSITITGEEDETEVTELWCTTICPGLPLNSAITGYKRTKAKQ
ncbi:uncharacterized protein LOC133186099 [Saccostrea echinata]|uniref:uncharacterized protein LOC133186099 n=1 Tax=Saccostrea echinata TaxID=191078 RepID=UPI002A81E7CA|nr:uncharacterized protein LOC133186099 [Saccostrea echinata]